MKGPVEIAPGVHGLGSEYVNWYLVEEGGRLTAVDAGMPAFAKHLDDDLRTLGRKRSDVAALVLTHSDADHTGVANELREGGARVLVHSADEGTLAKPRQKTGDANPRNALPYLRNATTWKLLAHMLRGGAARPPAVAGAETFADGDVLDVPGSPRVVHTPGHTPGHCVLLFEGVRALFAGDALCTFNPLTGERGTQLMPFPLNVDNEAARASLDRIEPLDADIMLPGHGDPARETPAAAAALARALR